MSSVDWISASVSEIQTVEVQSGGEVTLLCSNISTHQSQTDWFRVVNRTKPCCISSMFDSGGEASPCHGFNNGFEMSSNTSTVFLKIKQVKLSDSGLYFCGFYIVRNTVIGDATHLNVQDGPDCMANLVSVILGGLSVLLTIVVIALAVKIRKLRTAENEDAQPKTNKFSDTIIIIQYSQNLDSDDLNYAALSFQAKAKRNHRPASGRELEPNVVYAATR
ncbi:hypothetical protein L3Q82_017041 [Scortum barcoo]|uniref:Uncharacterized protein n=1 Tax=Scortum barcoo TaxID=214431 RepID=A0ACB8X996_9TELE|nr:hypothetical protein L3Q82_017041 [Scortum barcoo]